MSDAADSSTSATSRAVPEIQQEVGGDRNQTIGQVLGGMVVYVSGGQAIINTSREAVEKPAPSTLGAKPYKGLMAFQDTDGDRFFGREKQIAALWEKLRSLHETESAIRVLPIYGPSGSGKSSLARAGLIPELARHPIPGYDRARVAILVPGTHPLESLATVLARIVTQDLTPVAKTREFAGELRQVNEAGEYDGLRRITDVMPDIAIAPLVVLIDQFEEVYTLCKDTTERDAFIGNLLHAADDSAKRVTIIVTLRSDFLGETQKHSVLNRLFSEQGYLVPAMTPEELRQAIAKPAELAGHPLDTATIDLLVKDTEGREGALPLLQFALTRIWEGLAEGKQPAETLKVIGGVGGALAGEAQRIYDSLDEEGRAIARRLFLGLVQLGEGTKDTRRRALFDSLISYQDDPSRVKQVIDRFASPGVRLITLSTNGNAETAEVTHEALFDHWQQLHAWLETSRSDIRFQRRLEEAAKYWEASGKPEGLLWRSPDLEALQSYSQRASSEMASLQIDFLTASQQLSRNSRRWRKIGLASLVVGLLITSSTAGFALYQLRKAERQRVEQLATSAEALLFTNPTEALITSISAIGLSRSGILGFLNETVPTSVQGALLDSVQSSREIALLRFDGETGSVAFSPRGNLIAVGTDKGTLHLAALQGDLVGQPFRGHQGGIRSVAFSPDGKLIASGSGDETIRLWDLQGNLIGQPFRGHQGSVTSIAFSNDGRTIISGSTDETIRLWDLQGNLIGQPFEGDLSVIWSVAASPRGRLIASGSHEGVVRLWDFQGNQLWKRSRDNDFRTYSVVFHPDGQSIFNGNSASTVNRWSLDGHLVGYPMNYDQETQWLAISQDGDLIVAGGKAITTGKLSKPLLGHEDFVRTVAVSPDGEFIASGDREGVVRLWNLKDSPIGKLHRRNKYVEATDFGIQNKLKIRLNQDNTIQLSDFDGKNTRQLLLKGNSGDNAAVAINPKGDLIATVDQSGLGQLWNLRGEPVGERFKFTDSFEESSSEKRFPLYSISFDSSGNRVILSRSNNRNGTIEFFDLEGTSIGPPISGYTGSLNSITSTSEGLILSASGGEQWVLTWRDWLRVGCHRLQNHSTLIHPQTNIAREAKRTCQQYAWNDQ